MNEREVFDTVKAHLLTQGRRSLNADNGACAYRGANGTSCAVGCLIKDEFYVPEIENRRVQDSLVIRALVQSGIPDSPSMSYLLFKLQDIHDGVLPELWAEKLDILETWISA